MINFLINFFKNIVGPSAVIGAGTMGAGAIASLILAGAWFRYDMLWVILLLLPLFVISVDSASRIGGANPGQGMLSIMREHIHPSLPWILLIVNVPVHVLVNMGQFSVMTSSLLSILGFHPPIPEMGEIYESRYLIAELMISIMLAGAIVLSILSNGYERMQNVMTALMILMLFCFAIIAFRSISEFSAIASGFIPSIPSDLTIAEDGANRPAGGSIIAIVGSALAPGALLAIPYMTSDSEKGNANFSKGLRQTVLNLGVIYGLYAMFVLIAGGFALFPLSNNAQIETVHQAGAVLSVIFPEGIEFVGPLVFKVGLFFAALTTLVVSTQVICYTTLDVFRKNWNFVPENRLFRQCMIFVILVCAILAPMWSFPALLKVLLLMGLNVIVIPLVLVALIYLLNKTEVMGSSTAITWQNIGLVMCLGVAIALALERAPGYFKLLGT